MWPDRRTAHLVFKPRHYGLKVMERCLRDRTSLFDLSTRHKDILRCSATKHFKSCYNPKGGFRDVPFKLCTQPGYAILGKKDRSGQYLWRAFVFYFEDKDYDYYHESKNYSKLVVYKIYGNPPSDIKETILCRLNGLVDRVQFVDYDAA